MEYFFTKSEAVRHIIKGLNLTKTLFVSSILIGEKHTGKKRVVSYLYPEAIWVDGRDINAIKEALKQHNTVVITHFEQLSNHSVLDFQNKRIIAIAEYIDNIRQIDDLFAFIYKMPPLRERPEDVAYLKKRFTLEAKETLMVNGDIVLDDTRLDLSQNSKTLKKSIFQQVMEQNADESMIQESLYHYLLKRLKGNNAYKEHIALFEKPLIKAGLKKYGSQLQLSHTLGINRNTLRKKIHEHAID